jgi:transposase
MAHFTPITPRHTSAELRTSLRQSRDDGQKTRLKAIIFAQEGCERQEIVERLQVSDHSVTNWVHAYNEGGVPALATNSGGRPKGHPKWSADIFTALATEIDKGGYWSVPRMQEWLKKHYQKDIPEQTVWYRMDRLNYSYKSARPHPAQGSRERQDTFKKGASLRSWSRS